MTQEISSLMDGELAPDAAERAIGSCTASEDAKIDWHLYHVIGDAMRGQAPRTVALPTQVMEALKAQPTVLAPRRRPQVTFARVAIAAAASVATVGVVGWLGSQGLQAPSMPLAVKSGSSIQPAANTVALPQAQPAQAAVPATLDVQAYLAAHRQIPSPELYRPVNNAAPAAAAR